MIEPKYWQEAHKLTIDIDSNDISFVALALQKDAWLWTGDKKLSNHLVANGFSKVISTPDLYDSLSIS